MTQLTADQQKRAQQARAAQEALRVAALAGQQIAARRQAVGFSPRHLAVIEDTKKPIVWPDDGLLAAKLWESAKQGKCEILLGERGVGKTTLLSWLAWKATAEPDFTGVRMWQAAELIEHIQSQAFSGNIPRAQTIAKMACPRSLMLIDDLHRRRHNEEEMLVLGDLLNARYEAQAATVIAANYTPEAVAEGLGEDTMSRIGEWGGLRVMTRWPQRRPSWRAIEA